jgi:hypothetical protein
MHLGTRFEARNCIPKITEIIKRNTLSLYSRIFKYDSPARQLNIELLTKCLTTGQRVKGTILDRVLDFNLSPAGIVLDRVPRVKLGHRRDGADGVVDVRSSTCSIATTSASLGLSDTAWHARCWERTWGNFTFDEWMRTFIQNVLCKPCNVFFIFLNFGG